jgi:hypothetical protein
VIFKIGERSTVGIDGILSGGRCGESGCCRAIIMP